MAWIHGMIDRLSAIVRRGARDRELAEEIRFHLEMETARQRSRGHDALSAREAALVRFGNVTHVREATRDARGHLFLEGYMHDLTWAARSLRKQPGFSALALLTLALGVGCNHHRVHGALTRTPATAAVRARRPSRDHPRAHG